MSGKCPSSVQDRCKSYCNDDIVSRPITPISRPALTVSKICTGGGGGRAAGRCNTAAPSLSISDLKAGLKPGGFPSLSNPSNDNAMLQQPKQAAATQCSGAPPPDRGKQATGYSFYAKAAACYIYKRFNESKT